MVAHKRAVLISDLIRVGFLIIRGVRATCTPFVTIRIEGRGFTGLQQTIVVLHVRAPRGHLALNKSLVGDRTAHLLELARGDLRHERGFRAETQVGPVGLRRRIELGLPASDSFQRGDEFFDRDVAAGGLRPWMVISMMS